MRVLFLQCSKTCGKGVKTPIVSCMRTNADGRSVTVGNLECIALELEKPKPKPCDGNPCNASNTEWRTKEGTCSVTCGNGKI